MNSRNIYSLKKKKQLVFLSAFIFCVLGMVAFLAAPPHAEAASLELHGWAWSSNIGWVGFNCADVGVGVCDSSDYKVFLDNASSPAKLTGDAWSSSIGWIRFNPVIPCVNAADPNCAPDAAGAASVFTGTGAVTGWIRACSVFASNCSGALKNNAERGGWDGWIKLAGDYHASPDFGGFGGVTLDITKDKFVGFAWGGDVVGWLSFCESGGAPSWCVSFEAPPLRVDLTAATDSASWQQALSGAAPLNNVDLNATVVGAVGTMNYTFYCNRSDAGTNITPGWIRQFIKVTTNPLTVDDVCGYASPGTYMAKVIVVESDTGEAVQDQVPITVSTTGNNLPLASHAGHFNIPLGVMHSHPGQASDLDNDLVSYAWSFVSCPGACPSGSSGLLIGGNPQISVPALQYTPSAVGNYVIRLTVTDANGVSNGMDRTDSVASLLTFSQSCSDIVAYWPNSPTVDLDPPCDILVEFSPALTTKSSPVTITLLPSGGFNSPIVFDVVGVFNEYPAGAPTSIQGFKEVYNGTISSSYTAFSPYTPVQFSVQVNKLAADPENDLFYTVRLQESGGSQTKTLDLRLTLKASKPGFGEE